MMKTYGTYQYYTWAKAGPRAFMNPNSKLSGLERTMVGSISYMKVYFRVIHHYYTWARANPRAGSIVILMKPNSYRTCCCCV